jgi:hypothetical protein
MEVFSFYNAIFSVLFGVKHSLNVTDVLIAGGGALLLWLPLFILQGIALYKMAKKRNLKSKWFAFVPFLNILYIGRLTGDCLIFGRKMKRAGLVVMIAQAIAVVVTAAYVVTNSILFIQYGNYLEITSEYSYEWVNLPAQGEWLRRFIWVLDGGGGMIGVLQIADLAYKLLLLVLLMSFFRKYAPRQALLFSLISCFAPEARYIFIFVLKDKQAINYEEYMRRQQEEYIRRRQQSGYPYGPYGYGPYGHGASPNTQSNPQKAPEDPFAEFSSGTDGKTEQKGNSSNSSGGFFD